MAGRMRGGGMHGGGGACVARKTAIAAGGTHPTGIHSCYDLLTKLWEGCFYRHV